jgi:hypothetical protein
MVRPAAQVTYSKYFGSRNMAPNSKINAMVKLPEKRPTINKTTGLLPGVGQVINVVPASLG